MGRRPKKLQEFVAHSDTINCSHVGRQSMQLMATGGEDKTVIQ